MEVKLLESDYKDIARIVQDLPEGVVHARILIHIGWFFS